MNEDVKCTNPAMTDETSEGEIAIAREPMLTPCPHRNHFVNSKEGRALYGDDE